MSQSVSGENVCRKNLQKKNAKANSLELCETMIYFFLKCKTKTFKKISSIKESNNNKKKTTHK